MQPMKRFVVIVCLGMLMLGVACSVIVFRKEIRSYWCFPPDETTDPRDYSQVLRQWQNTGLADHFPEDIPTEARNVHLSSFPGFLQGGGWLQVRMELPASQVEQVLRDNLPRAIKQFKGGDKVTHYNECKVASTYFFTSGTKESKFPASYTILVLGNAGGWNHGSSYGVAIDQANNEVVYWAERW
jgi:hypothetical protein